MPWPATLEFALANQLVPDLRGVPGRRLDGHDAGAASTAERAAGNGAIHLPDVSA